MDNSIVEYFEGQEIEIRASDNYWNATQMCQKYNREFNDFYHIKSTRAYLAAFATDTAIPVSVGFLAKKERKGGNRLLH